MDHTQMEQMQTNYDLLSREQLMQIEVVPNLNDHDEDEYEELPITPTGPHDYGVVPSFYTEGSVSRLMPYVDDVSFFNDNSVNTCYDFEEADDFDSRGFIRANINEHLIFVNAMHDPVETLCTKRSQLKDTLDTPQDSISFECTGPYTSDERLEKVRNQYDRDHPYVKLTINKEGAIGVVPVSDIVSVINSKESVFFIVPHMINDQDTGVLTQQMITHSIGWGMTGSDGFRPSPTEALGAAHCQNGSNLYVYAIKVCDSKKCILAPNRPMEEATSGRDRSPPRRSGRNADKPRQKYRD
jgi:hypothetical protein